MCVHFQQAALPFEHPTADYRYCTSNPCRKLDLPCCVTSSASGWQQHFQLLQHCQHNATLVGDQAAAVQLQFRQLQQVLADDCRSMVSAIITVRNTQSLEIGECDSQLGQRVIVKALQLARM